MAEIPSQEGRIPFDIPNIKTPCFTYYKIFGKLSGHSPAVVALHGGPGAGHEYLLPFARLWDDYGLPVIFYDQIGCAGSTHLPETAGDESFWNEGLFIRELDNLLDCLRLRDGAGYHILGQSWGGNLGAVFAVRRPKGLQRLILASAVASTQLYIQGVQIHRSRLAPDVREALEDSESKGEFESHGYMNALDIYYKKHLCRVDPFPPPEMVPCMGHLVEDKTVYTTMNGVSPLTPTASRDWSCISRLPSINAPTLVYNGEFDTSHDIATTPFFENIPRVRWITFANAGHMCHLEPDSREKVLKTVGDFLTSKRKSVT